MLSIIINIILFTLKLRYKVKVKGLEKLNADNLNKPGGILFLPNHPSLMDPILVGGLLNKRFNVRSVMIEYMYYKSGVNWIVKKFKALPIPSFEDSPNSIKLKRGEKVFEEVFDSLRKGDNLLFYPAGRTKSSGVELIGGASGCKRILEEVPEANVVLVRTTGLWGSLFSRAQTGSLPPLGSAVLKGIKIAFKNLIFFIPKRDVLIEFEVYNDKLPVDASRVEFNHTLEQWYNKPFYEEGEIHGEPLKLVPYSIWSSKLPEITTKNIDIKKEFDLSNISSKIKNSIVDELVKLTGRKANEIEYNMDLSRDLGLDSLDAANLVLFLENNYHITNFSPDTITTVASLIALASGEYKVEEKKSIEDVNVKGWFENSSKRVMPALACGTTIPEVFLNSCSRMGKSVACADTGSGILTYNQMKLRVILIAEYIRTLPGKYIGIMLPSSVGADILFMAVSLSGKIPVMVNWTVGPRHFETVVSSTRLEVILSSWKFIDRVKNVDFNGIEDLVVMLEDIKGEFTLKRKVKAACLARKSTEDILKYFGVDGMHNDSPAVMLFTSGTENMPKGVPLTHKNILSNIEAFLPIFNFQPDDAMYGMLPPFHSFGFIASIILPLTSGIKVVHFPDPNDSASIAHGIKKWKASMICSAPTFLKGILSAGKEGYFDSLRILVSGAEKAPKDLYDQVAALGEGHHLIEGYGITECSPVLTANRLGEEPKGVGRPIENVDIAIIHPESHNAVPAGDQGLIIARGPNIFPGYLEGTSSKTPFLEYNGEQWYDTGDLGFIDEQGRLTISGRLKRFVKIGGEMLSLTALEETFFERAKDLGWTTEEERPSVVVTALEQAGDKTKLFLFSTFSVSVVQANEIFRKEGFSNLAKISAVINIEDIPIAGTGKVNYRLLEQQLKDGRASLN